jgi:hypothetical protein
VCFSRLELFDVLCCIRKYLRCVLLMMEIAKAGSKGATQASAEGQALLSITFAQQTAFVESVACRTSAGDEAGAEELRKQLLKGKLQMAGSAQRAGAAAGRPPTGQQAGKQSGKAAGNKRSTKRK